MEVNMNETTTDTPKDDGFTIYRVSRRNTRNTGRERYTNKNRRNERMRLLHQVANGTLEPEVAAKIALDAILACINPPGSQEIHLVTAEYIRCETPDLRIISPNKMNIGTATKRNSELLLQVISASPARSLPYI